MRPHESEVYGEPPPSMGGIYHGTVGWAGDPELETIGALGKCYVKVTMFEGAPPGQPASLEGGANGRRILAQLSWPNFAIPPRGAEVYLAIPAGLEELPGAALIIGSPQPAPARQFEATRMVLDFTGYDVVIKGKTVSLISEDVDDAGETVRQFVTCSQRGGAQIADDSGSGFFVKDGEVSMKALDDDGNRVGGLSFTQVAATLVQGRGSDKGMVKLKDGNATLSGNQCALNYGAIMLGTLATPANGVAWGASTPSVPSTSVWVAP